MPEPNEKMDALLKACAKRRQEEPGAPSELHPATRQMLQAEVSRAYPKAKESEKAGPGLFSILWPRLIFGGAFLAALIAVFFLVLSPKSGRVELTQNLGPQRDKENSVSELRKTSDGMLAKDIAAPTLQLDSKKEQESAAPTPEALLAGDAAAMKLPLAKSVAESLANEERIDRAGDKSKMILPVEAKPQKGGELLARSGTARRPADAPTEKQLLSNATVEALKPKPGGSGNAPAAPAQLASRALGETVSSNPPMALAMKSKSSPAPSAAPAPQPENTRAAGAPALSASTDLYFSTAASPTNPVALKRTGLADELKALAGGAGRFVQIDSRARFRRNFQSPPVPKVLTAFNLERDGNKIRITDADGSVYEGEIEPSNGPTPGPAAGKRAALGLDRGSQISAGEPVAFRVSGINKTLQQSVVFAGVLESAQLPKLTAGGAGIRDESAARKNDLDARPFGLMTSSPGFSIRGKASIGAANEFTLEAVPANP